MQQVIVYSNPISAMFWQTIMNTDFSTWVIIVLSIGIPTAIFVKGAIVISDKYGFSAKSKKYQSILGKVCLAVALISMFALPWFF